MPFLQLALVLFNAIFGMWAIKQNKKASIDKASAVELVAASHLSRRSTALSDSNGLAPTSTRLSSSGAVSSGPARPGLLAALTGNNSSHALWAMNWILRVSLRSINVMAD